MTIGIRNASYIIMRYQKQKLIFRWLNVNHRSADCGVISFGVRWYPK